MEWLIVELSNTSISFDMVSLIVELINILNPMDVATVQELNKSYSRFFKMILNIVLNDNN